MTKREMFVTLMSIPAVAENDELMSRLQHELDLLDSRKGGARKPTKTQTENEDVKNTICLVLADTTTPMRVRDLLMDDRLSMWTSAKLTALLGQMLDEPNSKGISGDGRVHRSVEKKVAYFALNR